jgi:hypothetical protein
MLGNANSKSVKTNAKCNQVQSTVMAVIPGRWSEAEASPESILLGRGYGFRAAGLRPAPAMTS